MQYVAIVQLLLKSQRHHTGAILFIWVNGGLHMESRGYTYFFPRAIQWPATSTPKLWSRDHRGSFQISTPSVLKNK